MHPSAQTSLDTPLKLDRYRYLCNSIAVVLVSMTTIFFCFSIGVPVDKDTINNISTAKEIFMVLLGVYWAVMGRHFRAQYVVAFFLSSPLGVKKRANHLVAKT
jgi:hypothetical protein